MALVTGIATETNNAPEVDKPQKKPARRSIVPILILLLVLFLISEIVAGGYWVYTNREELKEQFFPPKTIETVEERMEEVPKEKPPSFFRKLIKRDRTITINGTLLGDDGGIAVLANKKVLPEGTWINGIHILEITTQSVLVEADGLQRRLKIGETFDPDEK